MYLNKPDNKPNCEDEILIAIEVDGDNQFTTGWYDKGEQEYYQYDGELIDIDSVVGWEWKPTVEFL